LQRDEADAARFAGVDVPYDAQWQVETERRAQVTSRLQLAALDGLLLVGPASSHAAAAVAPRRVSEVARFVVRMRLAHLLREAAHRWLGEVQFAPEPATALEEVAAPAQGQAQAPPLLPPTPAESAMSHLLDAVARAEGPFIGSSPPLDAIALDALEGRDHDEDDQDGD
jgi:hypothetical protein